MWKLRHWRGRQWEGAPCIHTRSPGHARAFGLTSNGGQRRAGGRRRRRPRPRHGLFASFHVKVVPPKIFSLTVVAKSFFFSSSLVVLLRIECVGDLRCGTGDSGGARAADADVAAARIPWRRRQVRTGRTASNSKLLPPVPQATMKLCRRNHHRRRQKPPTFPLRVGYNCLFLDVAQPGLLFLGVLETAVLGTANERRTARIALLSRAPVFEECFSFGLATG